MSRPRILVLDDYDGTLSRLECWKLVQNIFSINFISRPITHDEMEDAEIVVLLRERTRFCTQFINRTPGLKHLALTGRISDQADFEELKRRNIKVSYTDGSGQSAAEQTIALLLGLAKKIHSNHLSLQNGKWHQGPTQLLAGKTLGILGLGRVGKKVAEFGKIFGMNLISWGPTGTSPKPDSAVLRLELNDVLSQSDYLVISLRLSEQTNKLIGEKELRLLKSGACIINTSRAEIIEKDIFYKVLSTGRIQAALDVHYQEPLLANDPIRHFPNVLLSPHLGYYTEETINLFYQQVVENILAIKNGQPYKNAFENK